MRSKFKWIFTLLLALSLQFSFAQEKTVSGVISDKSGPIPGANIVVKGTTRSTQTDFDGKYAIKASPGEILVISFTGYTNSTVAVGAASSYNVSLKEQSVKLEEVVIDGYRTTKKTRSAVAQSTVTAKALEGRPNANFIQSLQAQVPGLYIASSSGSPGTSKINSLIRGYSSLSGNVEPLYVIDGVPANQQVFRSINPNDIESGTVLKDAAATAIYGNRATGGVIVIKTKSGKFDQKLQVKYSGLTGFTTLQDNNYNITNTRQILTLERDFANGGGLGTTGGVNGGPMTDAEIAAYPINTNWKDIFFRTGITKSHDLSFSGGTNKTTNFTSLGYYEQEGIVPTTDFKRFSIRSNFTGKSTNDRFTYSTNIFLSHSRRNQLDQEIRDIAANVLQNPLQGLLSSLPYIDPSLYVNGQQLFDDFGAPSFQIIPYMLMDYIVPGNIPSTFNESKVLVNASGSYDLSKDFTFTSTAGMDYISEDRDFARAPQSYLAIVATPAGAQFGGTETIRNNQDFTFDFTNKLNYTHIFKEKHTFEANAFIEYVKMHRRFHSFTQTGLDPRTWALGSGTGWIPFSTTTPTLYRPAVSAFKVDAGLLSYFATADYDYDSRFGIAGTIRRDASYRFDARNRWGTFWSVAARWNVDKEKFMANTIFDELKFRASYGTTGNQNIAGGGGGINPYFLRPNLIRDTNTSANGYGNAPALGVGVIANPNILWETTAQFNVGVDFGLFDRLSGSFDFYQKRTTDLFDDIEISAVGGVPGNSIPGNNGSLSNKGYELALKYDVFKKGDFKFDVFVNAAYNKAVYLSTPDNNAPVINGNSIRRVGGLLFEYNLVPYIGVNNAGFTDADGNLQPADGNLLFYDINGNVTETISEADQRGTQKSPLPKYQGGFGFNASYKGFFLNTQFSFAKDAWRFDFDLTNLSDPTAIGVFPVTSDLLDAWDPTLRPNSNYPSLTATNLVEGDSFSDRWLTDASYIRLKNVSFGYNVPSKFLDRTALASVRVYTQFENLVTWTKWRGLDPESFGSSNQGGYPAPKTISFGLDLQF